MEENCMIMGFNRPIPQDPSPEQRQKMAVELTKYLDKGVRYELITEDEAKAIRENCDLAASHRDMQRMVTDEETRRDRLKVLKKLDKGEAGTADAMFKASLNTWVEIRGSSLARHIAIENGLDDVNNRIVLEERRRKDCRGNKD